MQITRRSFLTTSAVATGALALRSLRAAASASLTLTITHSAPTHLDLLSALATEFHAEQPGLTTRFITEGDNWPPELQSTLRESIIGALPDITWQSLTYTPILATRGIAQPLNGVAGEIGSMEKLGISRAALGAGLQGDKIFAVPFGTTLPAIYYNMTLLRKAGYSAPTPPTTWDEIIDIGKRVAAMDGHINGGYLEYTASNAWFFQNLIASCGGHMLNPAGSDIAFDSSEGLKALRILSNFGQINGTDLTQEQARQAFSAGASAIHIRSASGIRSVAQAATGRFELQVGAFPLSHPAGRLIGAGHGFFLLTRQSLRQQAGWEFLKFATQARAQAILGQYTGYLPANLLTLQDSSLLDQYLKANPHHKAIVKDLAITDDQYSFPGLNNVRITTMLSDKMRKVITRRETPEAALSAMATQTRTLLHT